MGNFERSDASILAAPFWARSSGVIRAIRRDAGRCNGIGNLFQRRAIHSSRDAALIPRFVALAQWRKFCDRMNNKQVAPDAGVSKQVDELATISVEELFQRLGASEAGLSEEEAERRLDPRRGSRELDAQRRSFW